MAEWAKFKEDDGVFIHTLAIEDTTAYMKVEKTRGGDYGVTALREGDACGGDVEYRPTLASAKKEAERIVANGEWQAYMLDGE